MQSTTENKLVSTPVLKWYNGSLLTFRVTPEQSGGELALIDMVFRQGAEPPAHQHTHEDETFIIQDGEVRFTIGEQTIDASPGESVFAPRGIRHSFALKTPTATFTSVITPGRFANYFLASSVDASGPYLPPAPQGPPPAEVAQRAVAEARTYGVLFEW